MRNAWMAAVVAAAVALVGGCASQRSAAPGTATGGSGPAGMPQQAGCPCQCPEVMTCEPGIGGGGRPAVPPDPKDIRP